MWKVKRVKVDVTGGEVIPGFRKPFFNLVGRHRVEWSDLIRFKRMVFFSRKEYGGGRKRRTYYFTATGDVCTGSFKGEEAEL